MNTLIFLFAFSGSVFMSTQSFTPTEQLCYGRAMIGYDSVINSRIGVLPEHAIGLTNDKEIRNIIWRAFLWQESPHEFAIKTFSECISSHEKSN